MLGVEYADIFVIFLEFCSFFIKERKMCILIYIFLFYTFAFICLVCYNNFVQLTSVFHCEFIWSLCHWKGPPYFLTEGHITMTKSRLACVYNLVFQVYWVALTCIFFCVIWLRSYVRQVGRLTHVKSLMCWRVSPRKTRLNTYLL